MADAVQAIMERMVPDIEDLEEIGYFTRQELKQVIDRRLHFESLIKSAVRKKEDFMRYIDYEIKLEKLRELRRKRFPTSAQLEASNADHCIVANIHKIFFRATRLYKDGIQLWLEWFEFCKMSRSFTRLSKSITEALRHNSHCPDLWIVAGQWEFNERSNPTGARSLMLLGIRMCKNSRILWLEYFKMEVAYAQRLYARRAILGVDAQVPGKEDPAMEELLQGGAAICVFDKGCESIPGDLEFRIKFLKHAAKNDFPGASHLVDHIFSVITKEFPTHADTWDMQARYSYTLNIGGGGHQEAMESAYAIYLKGLEAYPSEELYDCCCAFLCELLEAVRSSRDPEDQAARIYESRLQTALLDCIAKAVDKGLASEDLLLQWISTSKSDSCAMECLARVAKATTVKPHSARLWCERIGLFWLAQSVPDKGEVHFDFRSFKDLMKNALAGVPRTEHAIIWQGGLEVSVCVPVILEWLQTEVCGAFTSCTSDTERSALTPAVCSLLETLWRTKGVQETREVYEVVLRLTKPPAELLLQVIGLETQFAEEERLESLHIPRRLLERAVKSHPRNLDVWMGYAHFEHCHENNRKVYRRAVQLLEGPDVQKFIKFCNTLK